MAEHNDLGKWGEQVAMRYLDAKGFQLVAHDWRQSHRDIDIIAVLPSGLYVFVEVKTRSQEFMRDGMLTPEKRWHLARTVISYCRQHSITRARVDLIVVIGTPENYRVEHVEEVMIPSLTAPYHKSNRPWR